MKNSRRYYLHRCVRKFTKVDAHAKTLYYTESLLNTMTVNQIRYFLELQMKFKYSIQQEII